MTHQAPHGYTLTELLVASALLVVAGLGAALAFGLVARGQAQAEVSRAGVRAVTQLDGLARVPAAARCDVLRAVDPGQPELTCRELASALTQGGGRVTYSGPLTGRDGRFRLTIARTDVPGVQEVAVQFLHLGEGLLRHTAWLALVP